MSSAGVKLCLCLPGTHAADLWKFPETPPARHHAIPARATPPPTAEPRTCSPAPHQGLGRGWLYGDPRRSDEAAPPAVSDACSVCGDGSHVLVR
jgi:hypothetical protein